MATLPDGIIRAATISVDVCDNCDAIHFNLHDKDGVMFATASLPDELLDYLQPKLQEFRRYIHVRRLGKIGGVATGGKHDNKQR